MGYPKQPPVPQNDAARVSDPKSVLSMVGRNRLHGGPTDNLPSSIVHGWNESMPVVQTALGGKLGCLDLERQEIHIESEQPRVGKHVILLHEIIHLVAEHLKASNVLKDDPEEAFVENMAGVLLPILVLSGLWKGLNESEVKAFYEMHDTRGPAEVKKRTVWESYRGAEE